MTPTLIPAPAVGSDVADTLIQTSTMRWRELPCGTHRLEQLHLDNTGRHIWRPIPIVTAEQAKRETTT